MEKVTEVESESRFLKSRIAAKIASMDSDTDHKVAHEVEARQRAARGRVEVVELRASKIEKELQATR